MPNWRSGYLSLVILFLFGAYGASATASELEVNSFSRTAELGSAYKADQEVLVGQACVTGDRISTGAQTATFSFDQSLNMAEAAKSLGVELGGRGRFGVVKASAEASFLKRSTSSQFAIATVWLSEYRLPVAKLANPTLSSVGKAVSQNPERWNETCGDEFVDEIELGAKLFFSITIEFQSEEEKEAFSAKVNLDAPLWGAQASLDKSVASLARNAKIKVSAFQKGGDVTQASKIFIDPGAASNGYLECSGGDFKKCAEVVTNAINYAADVKDGFPSQLSKANNAAQLLYRTSKYSSAAIYTASYPGVEKATELARKTLHQQFEIAFAQTVVIDQLLSLNVDDNRKRLISAQKKLVDANITMMLDASKICYDTPLECHNAVASLSLNLIDESIISLPPLPKASFRIWTTSRGIWARADSVNELIGANQSWIRKKAPDFSDYEKVFGRATPQQYLERVRTDNAALNAGAFPYPLVNLDSKLSELGDSEGASVVLLVEGTALHKATLYFDRFMDGEIPIDKNPAYPEKVTASAAAIVIKTQRGNLGWLDFDLDRRLSYLKVLAPRMDGAFYILVNDGFGRTTRFDIGYANWEVTKVPDDIAKQVIDADPDTASQAALDQQRGVTTPVFQNKFLYRDRWWDPESDGTSLTKGENWTNWIVQEQLSIGVALPVSRTTAERNDNFPDGDPSDPDYDPRVRAFDQAVPVK